MSPRRQCPSASAFQWTSNPHIPPKKPPIRGLFFAQPQTKSPQSQKFPPSAACGGGSESAPADYGGGGAFPANSAASPPPKNSLARIFTPPRKRRGVWEIRREEWEKQRQAWDSSQNHPPPAPPADKKTTPIGIFLYIVAFWSAKNGNLSGYGRPASERGAFIPTLEKKMKKKALTLAIAAALSAPASFAATDQSGMRMQYTRRRRSVGFR